MCSLFLEKDVNEKKVHCPWMRMRKSELSLDEKRKSPTGKKRGGFCPGEKNNELSFDE